MPIKLDSGPKRDSRGLPEGYDPEGLFQYRYSLLYNSARGVESLLYKLIPVHIIRSVTFAIDPTYRFKIAPATITSSNRRRVRGANSVLLQRQRVRRFNQHNYSQESNYKGHSFCSSPYFVHGYYSWPNPETWDLTAQAPLLDEINDTTGRTRIVGSKQGEMDYFKSTSNSPPRISVFKIINRRYTSGANPSPECMASGGTRDYEVGSEEVWTTTFGPSAATLSSSIFETLQGTEIEYCRTKSAELAIPMLKDIGPFSRSYSLARNIAELKDIPRSIVQVQRTMNDLKRVYTSIRDSKIRGRVFDLAAQNSTNIPREYVGFHFGWKQTYKDLRDLLALPDKLGKKIDFLIRRSGKDTTFRSKRNWLTSEPRASGYVYDATENDKEWNISHQHRLERVGETRLVINAGFDFPPLNAPHLRERFFLDQVGLIPRFTDVYNIIPWTWLVDWFTGFGNYLELIENINHDPSLINWGVITSHTKGRLVTEFSYINATQNDIYVNNVRVSPEAALNTTLSHTSVLEYECQTRQNVANVMSVKRTTEPASLSGYQLSILGSILASRVDTRRI